VTEAIVLVGGQGTRLRPLTLTTPKPLLPLAGQPLVAHQFARLAAAGITRIVLATSYQADLFGDLVGMRSDGVHVDTAVETVPLGTGGAIRNVLPYLRSGPDDPVVILNGDIMSGHDIADQLAFHRDHSADVTLHLVRVADPRAFGCVPTDQSRRVTAFLEKTPDPVTDEINAGCYVFRRGIIDSIPSGRAVSVERETFPDLLAAHSAVFGYLDESYWLDLGTPAAYIQASRDLVLGDASSPATPAHTADYLVLEGAVVAPSASVTAGSTIGRGAVVEDSAVVEGSVLLDGSMVRAGACVRDSVVGRDAVIGEQTVLDGAVIGDRAVLGSRNELLAGARVWPGVRVPDLAIRFSADE
jgi:mannose-1-phosphate guanylyltransferase